MNAVVSIGDGEYDNEDISLRLTGALNSVTLALRDFACADEENIIASSKLINVLADSIQRAYEPLLTTILKVLLSLIKECAPNRELIL
jgi:hypothetical protein